MAINLVNVGIIPNDFTGDPLRDAFIKINSMFTELYAQPDLSPVAPNLVYAGPVSGGSALPTFRSLVAGDMPDLSSVYSMVGHSHLLGDLTNVEIVSVVAGEILFFNGSDWINATLTEAGIAPASHTHLAAHITDLASYTGFDARYYTETEINNFFAGVSAITGYNKVNWDAAFAWGNHASAGYLSSVATDGVSILGDGTVSNPLTVPPPTVSGTYSTGFIFTSFLGGLEIEAIWPLYYISGVPYSASSDSLFLDAADVTFDRFDALILTSTGLSKITGVASANPEQPYVDSTTQLLISYILVEAGAVDLTDDVIVYDEGTETTVTSNNGTVNPLSISSPLTGTYNLDVGAFNNTHYIDFTFASPKLRTDFEQIRFFAWLKDIFSAGGTPTYFILTFFDGASPVSSSRGITTGSYNFVRTLTLTWQTIIVPLSAFTFTSNTFTKIRMTFNGSNATGFKVDNFLLQSGIVSSTPLQNAIVSVVTDSGTANADQPSDIISIVGAGGAQTSALGKVVTVTQKNQVIPYANLAALPVTGVAGIIYITIDTDLLYRWDGAAYVSVGGGGGGIEYATAAGTDTYTTTITGVTAYTEGDVYAIKFTNANTASATLNINAIGAVTLKKEVSANLASADLEAGGIYMLIYDGTNFQVIGLGGGGGGHEIVDQDGNPLVQEPQLQFVRLNVTADTGKTVVTRPADTFVGISPPSSPVEGDIWTDTNDTVWKTYVRYDGYWVEQIASGGGGGGDEDQLEMAYTSSMYLLTR